MLKGTEWQWVCIGGTWLHLMRCTEVQKLAEELKQAAAEVCL